MLYAQAAQTLSDRVLVVYNSNAAGSEDVAKYYRSKRAIPATNVCKISAPPDNVNEQEFVSQVKEPIRRCLDKAGKDKILYIAMAYQTPFALVMRGKRYALDSFLADIWDEFLPFRGAEQNEVQPYFGGAQSEGGVYEPYVPLASYREKPGAKRLYSVWRLDAANAALAKSLIDKAIYAETNGLRGRACFDRRFGDVHAVADFSYEAGDWDLFEAAEFARKAGFSVLEDARAEEFGTAPAPLRCDDAALYAGWYSLDHYNDAFSWNPGAIGIHLDSASAENPRSGPNWAENAVKRGITVTSGAVEEPYLDNLPHPDQAFLYLFQAANVGDALLRSTRMLKWMILNIGDPLYRPFPNGARLAAPPVPELIFGLLPQLTLSNTRSAALVGVNTRQLPTDWTVTIRSDRPDVVDVPKTVTIPQGSSYARFNVMTKAVQHGPVTVRISVSANGLTRSNTLIVYPPRPSQ